MIHDIHDSFFFSFLFSFLSNTCILKRCIRGGKVASCECVFITSNRADHCNQCLLQAFW